MMMLMPMMIMMIIIICHHNCGSADDTKTNLRTLSALVMRVWNEAGHPSTLVGATQFKVDGTLMGATQFREDVYYTCTLNL